MQDNEMSGNELGAQPQGYSFVAGAAVFDPAGARIGSVSDRGIESGHLVIRHGLLPPREAFVPLSYIARLDISGIYLDLTGDALNDMDHDISLAPAPVAHTGTPEGQPLWHVGAHDAPLGEPTAGPMTQRAPLYIRPIQSTQGPGPGTTPNLDPILEPNTEPNTEPSMGAGMDPSAE